MRRTFFAVVVLLVALPLAAQSPWIRLPGMKFAGQITRDANGMAHIQAFTDYDAIFLNGYVHAQDRLFQMDQNRRLASGTFAELAGAPALPTDIQLRTLGIRRAAMLSEAEASPKLRELMAAYAAGVNAWVTTNPLPPEYAALEITKFEPWTSTDSFAVGKVLTFQLGFDSADPDYTVALLTYQGVGQVAGFDGAKLFFDDLWRSQPFNPASTVPDATAGATVRYRPSRAAASEGWTPSAEAIKALDPEAVALAKSWADELRKLPFFGERAASNEWAIAGKLSATGNALVCNDPHLALGMPSIFYPIAIKGSTLNVVGMGFPGAPLVVHGNNANIAWGSTVNPLDLTDWYQEQVVPDATAPAGLSSMFNGKKEALFPILQTFRANNPANGTNDDLTVIPPSASVPQATLIVARRNAPIVSFNPATGAAVSVQWIGHGATRELETFLIWNQARNLDDFKRGLEYFDGASQNWIYGDTSGNIGYFTSGELPLREDLQAGKVNGLPPWFLRDGRVSGNDWLKVATRTPAQASMYQILPTDEMPHIVNPAGGWIVNANNDPAGNSLDNNPLNEVRPGGGIFYLNPGYSQFRAGRITQLVREQIARNEKFTVADMQRIQSDVGSLDAQFFVPYITAALENGRSSPVPALAGLAADPGVVAAAGRLASWNFSMPTGIPEGYDSSDVNGSLSAPSQSEIDASVDATIYSVWRGQIIKNTIDAVLAVTNMPKPDSQSTVTALRVLLENFDTRYGAGASGVNFFNVPGIPNTAETAATRRDLLILTSLANALQLLAGDDFAPAFNKSTDLADYRWGRLHRIVFSHPLGGPFNTPPAGGAFPPPLAGLNGIPVDGGFEVVDASSHSPRAATLNGFMFGSGPARRVVNEATSSGIKALTALPGGPSGVLTSPLYVNLLRSYLTDDYFPVDVQTGPSLPWGAK